MNKPSLMPFCAIAGLAAAQTPPPGRAPVTGGRACNPEPGPLLLRDHYHPDAPNTPIKFPNIWLRPLEDLAPGP